MGNEFPPNDDDYAKRSSGAEAPEKPDLLAGVWKGLKNPAVATLVAIAGFLFGVFVWFYGESSDDQKPPGQVAPQKKEEPDDEPTKKETPKPHLDKQPVVGEDEILQGTDEYLAIHPDQLKPNDEQFPKKAPGPGPDG